MENNKSYLRTEKGICKKCKKQFWKQGRHNYYCESCKRKARNICSLDFNENSNFSPKKNRSCIKKNFDKN